MSLRPWGLASSSRRCRHTPEADPCRAHKVTGAKGAPSTAPCCGVGTASPLTGSGLGLFPRAAPNQGKEPGGSRGPVDSAFGQHGPRAATKGCGKEREARSRTRATWEPISLKRSRQHGDDPRKQRRTCGLLCEGGLRPAVPSVPSRLGAGARRPDLTPCARVSSRATVRTRPPRHHTQAHVCPLVQMSSLSCLPRSEDGRPHHDPRLCQQEGTPNLIGGAAQGWAQGLYGPLQATRSSGTGLRCRGGHGALHNSQSREGTADEP